VVAFPAPAARQSLSDSTMDQAEHRAEILDQFSRQAGPFLERQARGREALLALMADGAGLREQATVMRTSDWVKTGSEWRPAASRARS